MPAKQSPRVLKPRKEGFGHVKEQGSRKWQPSGRISAACEACKRRKTKCSGHPPPCLMCNQLDTPCVIDLSMDMRRRTGLQRIVEESKVFQETLNGIVSILRGGNISDIERLVTHVQQASNEDDLVDTLQTKFQQAHSSHSSTTDLPIKEEADEDMLLYSDSENFEPTQQSSMVAPGELQKHVLSTPDDDEASGPFSTPVQLGSTEKYEFEYIASQYLPLISKLKTVSNREASQILHDFRTSPTDTNEHTATNFHHRQESRSILDLQTGSHFRRALSGDAPDRVNWHPSLQLLKSDDYTQIAGDSLRGQWSNWSSNRYAVQSFEQSSSDYTDTGYTSKASASDLGSPKSSTTLLSETQPQSVNFPFGDASQEIQSHPAVYDAMQVHKTSQVLEMFGDLRALGGSSSRNYDYMRKEFAVRSSATIPLYLVQSRLAVEDSPLSKVFTGFRDAARQMIATGTPASDIVGGNDVVVDLFFRERGPADGFTCSSWACELLKSLEEINNFVRLGCIILLTKMMRWMVYPTAETYTDIPKCQRPTPTQCFLPHMPAIDLHPIPAMRDMLCERLQDWMTPMTSTGLSCNWPFTMEEALEIDAVTGSRRPSQRFRDHISEGENWSMNSYAISMYPELEGKIRIKDA